MLEWLGRATRERPRPRSTLYERIDMAQRTCSVEGCGKPVHGRSLCEMHYRREQRRGAWPRKQRLSLAERFQRETMPGENGCIVWTGARNNVGYGQLSSNIPGRLARRAAWVLAHGPIPEGLCVLHRCDNRPCVNVDHLFLGTQSDNMRDMVAKGRNAHGGPPPKTHCPQGHPYDDANTMRRKRGNECRACANERDRQRRRRSAPC